MHPRLQQFVKCTRLFIKEQSGQDMVEYALVIALITLGATASMHGLAQGIKNAFNSVSNVLATDI